MINAEWIIKAVETIKSGLCDRINALKAQISMFKEI